MNRAQVTISYVDGAPDDVVVLRPVTIVAAERHFRGTPPPIEGTLWAAWHQLRTEATFADWLERVDAVAEDLVPPLSATPSAPSPSSPSS